MVGGRISSGRKETQMQFQGQTGVMNGFISVLPNISNTVSASGTIAHITMSIFLQHVGGNEEDCPQPKATGPWSPAPPGPKQCGGVQHLKAPIRHLLQAMCLTLGLGTLV